MRQESLELARKTLVRGLGRPSEADRVRGVFFKAPGATDILVYCPEPAMKCTCVVSAYKAEDGTSKTLLTVDLTEEYQAFYPEAGITKAVRREYTSANAK